MIPTISRHDGAHECGKPPACHVISSCHMDRSMRDLQNYLRKFNAIYFVLKTSNLSSIYTMNRGKVCYQQGCCCRFYTPNSTQLSCRYMLVWSDMNRKSIPQGFSTRKGPAKDSCTAFAMERTDQWVAVGGRSCVVISTIRVVTAVRAVAGRPPARGDPVQDSRALGKKVSAPITQVQPNRGLPRNSQPHELDCGNKIVCYETYNQNTGIPEMNCIEPLQ